MISTAARMSASFPYVSPAAILPLDRSRRVVDAGYYDNYGLSTATTWVQYCLGQYPKTDLVEHCSGIIIIQIRDSQNTLQGNHPALSADPPDSAFGRGLQWLTSPLEAVLAARDSVSLFRNDASLERLSQLFDDRGYDGDFFTTVQFEYSGGALTWYLTGRQRDDLLGAAAAAERQPPGDYVTNDARDKRNAQQMDALKAWWQAHGGTTVPPQAGAE
jgi:hypothetical protein